MSHFRSKNGSILSFILLSPLLAFNVFGSEPDLEQRKLSETDPLCNFELDEVNDNFTGIAEGAVYQAIINADTIARDALKDRRFGPIFISPNPIDCTEENIKSMGVGEAWKKCMGMPEILVQDKDKHPGYSRMVKPYGPAAVKIENIEVMDLVFENGENKAKMLCNRVECKAQFPLTSLIVKGDVYMISLIDLANQGVDFDKLDSKIRNEKIEQALLEGKGQKNRLFHLKDWQFTIKPEAIAPYITYKTCIRNAKAPDRKVLTSQPKVIDEATKQAAEEIKKSSSNPVGDFFDSAWKAITSAYNGCMTLEKVVQLQPSTGKLDLTVRSMSAGYYLTEQKKKVLVYNLRKIAFGKLDKAFGKKSRVFNSVSTDEEKQRVMEAIELILNNEVELPDYESGNKAWIAELGQINSKREGEIKTRRLEVPAEKTKAQSQLLVAQNQLEEKETEIDKTYIPIYCSKGLEVCDKNQRSAFEKAKKSLSSNERWAVQNLESKLDRLDREVQQMEAGLNYQSRINSYNAKRHFGLVDIIGLDIDGEYLSVAESRKFEDDFYHSYNFDQPMDQWIASDANNEITKLKTSDEYIKALASHKQNWLNDGVKMREHGISQVLDLVGAARYEGLREAVLSSHHQGRVNDFHTTVMFFTLFNTFIADGGLFLDTFSDLVGSSILPSLSVITNGFLEKAPMPVCISGETSQ